MNRNLLRTIGIINIIFGIIFTLTIIGSIIGIPLIVSGALYLEYASLDDGVLIAKRNSIKAWSIIFIFINFISAILSFLALNDIDKYIKKDDYDPSSFRLNFLLNLGMSLILLSGIILASTSWNSILDYVKTILLFLFGIIFIFLSFLLSKRKSLKYTSNTYWFIGCIIIAISFYSCGYFEIFGSYFSLNGLGRNLFISIISLISTIIFFLSHRKFNSKFLLVTSFISFFVTLSYLISYFTNNIQVFSIIFMLVLTIFNIINVNTKDSKKYFMNLCNIITCIYFIFIFILNIATSDTILMLINNILYVSNLFILSFKTKLKRFNIFIIIALPILILLYCYKFLSFNVAIISSSIAILLFYGISYIFKSKNYILVSGIIISNILLFINYIISYFSDYFYFPLIISIMLILIYIPLIFINNYMNKYLGEIIVQPIKALLLCISSSFLLINCGWSFGFMSYIVVCANILFIFSLINRNSILRNIYFILSYSLLFMCLIPININIVFRINIVVMWILGYLIITMFDKNNWLGPVNYIFYLFSLITLFSLFKYLSFSIQLSLLNILIYLFLAYLFRNNRFKCFTALVFLLLPYYSLINILDISSSVLHILRFAPYILYIYLFTYTITRKYNTLNIILEIVVSLLVFIILVFEGSIEVSIFVLICSIIMIIYDALFKHISLFINGLVALILNILINIFKYWSVIPAWLYLLVGGIALITIITIQELRKNKN